MANLAHRASQFMDKKFLIIHPTADGRTHSASFYILRRKSYVVSDILPRRVSSEKVHFQHTAKLITQLINEKANYTLQVGELWPLSPLL